METQQGLLRFYWVQLGTHVHTLHLIFILPCES